MNEAAHRITIPLGERAYDVLVGEGLLRDIGTHAQRVAPASRAFVVIDHNLPAATADSALNSLKDAGYEVTPSTVEATEANKTIATTDRLLHEIAGTKHERTDPVIAIGGGIVTDIAGFVAATFKRGVPVVQCPTTLLAMVDASVGGKTGVNLTTRTGLKKNLVGAFWQPSLVLADIAALGSLDKRDLAAGLGECIKHGMIASSDAGPGEDAPGSLFMRTNDALVRVRMGEFEGLPELVAENVRVKAAFVAGDERETAPSAKGGRALLNLGHTFGHAIETLPHLTPNGDPEQAPLRHGEAVGLGLIAACGAAHHLGMIDTDFAHAVRVAVERMGIESRLMGLPTDDALLEVMAHDKKVSSGRLRFVLPDGPGSCVVVTDPPRSAMQAGWDAIRVHPELRGA